MVPVSGERVLRPTAVTAPAVAATAPRLVQNHHFEVTGLDRRGTVISLRSPASTTTLARVSANCG